MYNSRHIWQGKINYWILNFYEEISEVQEVFVRFVELIVLESKSVPQAINKVQTKNYCVPDKCTRFANNTKLC